MKHPPPVPRDELLVRSDDSCMKSTVRFTGYGVLGGIVTSVVVAQNPHNMHYLEVVGTSLVRYIFPTALVGAMFASTTCLMDEMRGRETPVSNGFIGGAVAGIALGSKSGSPGKAAMYGWGFGLLGAAARVASTNALFTYNPKARLKDIDDRLFINDIRHLDPTNSK